jgi:signal transduction histidine kinase
MSMMLFDSSARGTTEEIYPGKNDEVVCNEIARECITGMQEQYPEMPMQFSSDMPDDFSITTNRNYLRKSIHELLYNAAKYSDGKHISLHVSESGSKINFIFEDTGPGIAEEDCSHLFEMFTKVNDLSEGLGLGLPLCKRHALSLGGDLIYDESYHDGCRFFLEMPK